MALTEPATRQEGDSPPAAPGRRSLINRLSLGHVVMILAGLVAVLLNLAVLRSNAETARFIVASGPLPAGTELTSAAVDLVEVADAGALAGGLITFDDGSEVFGSILARPIAAGEPIRRSDLRPEGTGSGLREYSLELDAARAAGGQIAARDVVDVIATVAGRSYYVASTVEVVSVHADDSSPGLGDDLILVLSVDDATALNIAAAESVGTISVTRATGADPPTSGPVTIMPAP